MKIKSVIKKEEVIEKEINLPHYCKEENYKYMKVVSEEVMIVVIYGEGVSPMVYKTHTSFSLLEIGRGEEISDNEFNSVFECAMGYIRAMADISKVPEYPWD